MMNFKGEIVIQIDRIGV